MAQEQTLLGWSPRVATVALVGGLLLLAAGLVSAYGPRAESCWLSPGPEAMVMYERYAEAVGHSTSISSWPTGRTCAYSSPTGGETVTIGPGWLPTIYLGVGLAVSLASCVALSRRLP